MSAVAASATGSQSLNDFIRAAVQLRADHQIAPALGLVIERAACLMLDGDPSAAGDRRDFASDHALLAAFPKVTDPRGVGTSASGSGMRVAYRDHLSTSRQQRNLTLWSADHRKWVEVKSRTVEADDDSFFDTRSAGPNSPFLPFSDAYVTVLVDVSGEVLDAWLIAHEELMEYVASETRRGGRWNYKVAFSRRAPLGVDVHAQLVAALEARLPAQPV